MQGKFGKLVLFGSGETSEIGATIQRKILRTFSTKRRVAILETPAGFQPNSGTVAKEIADSFTKNLTEFVEFATVIPARKKGIVESPDNEEILKPLIKADYIFLGPGSPTYAVRQLINSKALKLIYLKWAEGATLALSSAAAIAAGKFTLPVYEIYKAGNDLYWINGLGLLSKANLPITVISHWNNNEGGKKNDTSRCFMGKKRFEELQEMLSFDETILGIDENTAFVFDFENSSFAVIGIGNGHLIKNSSELIFETNNVYDISSISEFEGNSSHLSIEQFLEPKMGFEKNRSEIEHKNLSKNIILLLKRRSNAKSKNDFTKADQIRNKLLENGFEVRDTEKGQKIYKP